MGHDERRILGGGEAARGHPEFDGVALAVLRPGEHQLSDAMPGSTGSCEVSHRPSIRPRPGKHDYDAEVSGADQGINPHTGEPVGAAVPHTPPSHLDQLAMAAKQAAHQLAAMPLPRRAALL